MSEIQVDMFEVQLGAALLLQFKTGKGRVVRVLADAGVTASGYRPDHVRNKLQGAFTAFNGGPPRLDLIIGTHYDADHLDGLVPIIEDRGIDIGEAWMPPVANDTQIHAEEESIEEHHLLGHQFSGEGGEGVLASYLNAKADICAHLRDLEVMANEYQPDTLRQPYERIRSAGERVREGKSEVEWFKEQIKEASYSLGQVRDTHADDDIEPSSSGGATEDSALRPYFVAQSLVMFPLWLSDAQHKEYFKSTWSGNPALAVPQARSMAYIRRSAAKDAINAASLCKVVKALKMRGIPTSYQMIKDGQPRRFVWKEEGHRFVPGAQLTSDGPELTLLGPSEGLVKKHWNKLPIGNYLARLALMAVPVKSITASNQLSYVARLSAHEQGLLVCGDAGCVDFKPARGNYYTPLLNALGRLHIIQIAHHGGNNAHFYNVLLEAGYPKQTDSSLLLLSHATDDKSRPSKNFGLFIEQARKEGDDMKLLFTSQPTADKVKDYKRIIHTVVGAPNKVGDIRVQFDGGHWKVLNHAIKV
ncbi:MAG: hypothetical protein HY444_07705 [Nitrospirae bacterium]|nr:hypothetical protein [Nitrospirota bacterium]